MADPKYRTSCDACLNSKVKCSQTKPSCWRCTQQGQECIYSQYRRIGRPPKRPASALASQQQRVTSDMAWKQAQQRQQHPSHTQHQTQPQKDGQPCQDNGLGDAHTDSSGSSMAIPALSTNEGSAATPEAPDISTSNGIPWASGHVWPQEGLPTAQYIPESFEPMADFASFEYDIPASDLAELSHIFDLTSCPLPTPETVQPDITHDATSPNRHPDPNIFAQPAGSFTSSAQSRRSGGSPTAGSTTSGHAQVPVLPLQQSAHSISARGARAFNSRGHCPFPLPGSLIHLPENASSAIGSSSLGRHQKVAPGQAGTPTASGRLRKFPLQSTTDSRCSGQCHASLTEQLNRLSECRSDDCSVPLDVLLNLDKHVRREREKVLRCPSCLGKTKGRQTLMLIIMVLENLLSLFEKECDVDQVSSAYMLDEAESLTLRQELGSVAGQRRYEYNRNGALSPLPQTSQPLIVGDFEVDESVKAAFFRQLLRMHFERQLVTVSELDQILATGTKDVGHKVAREILVDIYRRVEYFQGLMAFMD